MRKFLIIVLGIGIYLGEVLLIIILLSAVNSFFDDAVTTFPPTSSDYLQIAIIFVIRAIALAVAILLLRRDIMLAKKDWANPQDFWFLKA